MWNKALSLDDYKDLQEEVQLVVDKNAVEPYWMFIHPEAIHRKWEYASMYKFALEHLPPNALVLEFGGAASPQQATPLAPLLAQAGMRVVTSDEVRHMGAGVRMQNKIFGLDIACLYQNGVYMAIGDSQVDFVCSISVMEHIRDDMLVLQESVRVLRDGGYLGFTCDFSHEPVYLPGMATYSPARLDEIKQMLISWGCHPVDEPDYSSTEKHVLWDGQRYNFARFFVRKGDSWR